MRESWSGSYPCQKANSADIKARIEQTDLGIKLGDVYHPYDVTIAIFPGFYAEVV